MDDDDPARYEYDAEAAYEAWMLAQEKAADAEVDQAVQKAFAANPHATVVPIEIDGEHGYAIHTNPHDPDEYVIRSAEEFDPREFPELGELIITNPGSIERA